MSLTKRLNGQENRTGTHPEGRGPRGSYLTSRLSGAPSEAPHPHMPRMEAVEPRVPKPRPAKKLTEALATP